MSKYVLAIDQGTTSTRAILFDHEGKLCFKAFREVPCLFPHEGWVEVSPLAVWVSVVDVVSEVLINANATFEDVAAIGIANQRETTIVWDRKTGVAIYNGVVWQSRQSLPICEKFADRKEYIHKKTGLLINPYFSASKIRFILDAVPGAQKRAEAGELLFGTIDCWIIYKLTKGKVHATDVSNASRTMLFNIHALKWDDDLLKLFRIPRSMLPEVRASSGDFGAASYFNTGVRIQGVAGDQQASLFGHTCFDVGECKNTYGTGCFMLMNTGDRAVLSKKGLLTTIAWKIGKKVNYALEGSVFVGGAAVQWLRDELKFIKEAAESEKLARKAPSTGGVYFVPAFVGLGTPYWDDDVRGAIFGLTRASGRSELARATLEAIAYQSKDVLDAMEEESGIAFTKLDVDGGAAENGFLLQFQSDISEIEITKPECVETTALGAAYLAGLAAGFWKSFAAIKKTHRCARTYRPKMDPKEAEKKVAGYHLAVKAAMVFKPSIVD